jgi:hypothetical protein
MSAVSGASNSKKLISVNAIISPGLKLSTFFITAIRPMMTPRPPTATKTIAQTRESSDACETLTG